MGNFIFFLALLGALCNATLVASGPIEYYSKSNYSKSTDPTKSDRGLQYDAHYSDYNFGNSKELRNMGEQLGDIREQLVEKKLKKNKLVDMENKLMDVENKLMEQLKELQVQLQQQHEQMQNQKLQNQKLQDQKLQDQKLQDQKLQDQKLQDQKLQKKLQNQKLQDRKLQALEENLAEIHKKLAEIQKKVEENQKVEEIQKMKENLELRIQNLGENLGENMEKNMENMRENMENMRENMQKNMRENMQFKNIESFEKCCEVLFETLETMKSNVNELSAKFTQVYERDSATQAKIHRQTQRLETLHSQTIETTRYMQNLITTVFNGNDDDAKELMQNAHDEARAIMERGKEKQPPTKQRTISESTADGFQDDDDFKTADGLNFLSKDTNTYLAQATNNGTRKTVDASRTILFPSGLFGFTIFTTVFISCVYYAMRSKQKQEDGRSRRKE